MVKPQDKERLAKKAYELGYYHESHEGACSQSTVAAVMETLNFRDEGIFKACTPLTGGGALFGDSGCGTYNGGLLSPNDCPLCVMGNKKAGYLYETNIQPFVQFLNSCRP